MKIPQALIVGFAAVFALLTAGCPPAALDSEEQDFMTNAAIYEIDGSTLVSDTLEGDLYLVTFDRHAASQSSGSVSGGRLTAELPGVEAIANTFMNSDIFDAGELVPPTACIFPGIGFELRDADGEPLGSLFYGEIETDADLGIIEMTQALFFYSDLLVSVNNADGEWDIDGAPAGWSVATMYSDQNTIEMTNHTSLPAGAKWLFGPARGGSGSSEEE